MVTGLGNLGQLPREIIHNVAGFLSRDDAFTLAKTSRAMKDLLCDFKIREYSAFWEKIAQGIEEYFIGMNDSDKKRVLAAISLKNDWGTDLETIEKKGEKMIKVFLESVGYPKKWRQLDFGWITFSIVYRLEPYPLCEKNDLFVNGEMEVSGEERLFMVPFERQSSLCVAQLFHFISKNQKDFSAVVGALLEAQEWGGWGVSEYELAGVISARLIDLGGPAKFKGFFDLIKPAYQEQVVIKTARAFTMSDYLGEDGGGFGESINVGLFGILMRSIAFEKMSAKTQLTLVRMLIIADCGEALVALDKMRDGVEKNVARVEMVYYFYRVVQLDKRLPIEQRRNFTNLMVEVQNIPEDMLEKRISKALVKYLTLVAGQRWEVIEGLYQDEEVQDHLPIWSREEEIRSCNLSRLGHRMIHLFQEGVALPVDEEILDFFKESRTLDTYGLDSTSYNFIEFFPYFKEAKNALQALDSALTLLRDWYDYHADPLGLSQAIEELAQSLDKCSPAIQNSTVFLLKIADFIESIDPYEIEEGTGKVIIRSRIPVTEEAVELQKGYAIKIFIEFSYRRVQGEEAFLRLIRLVKEEEMPELYPLFFQRLEEFWQSKEVMQELLSFLSCENRKNWLEQFTPYWTFVLREGMLGKEEVLGYIREIESDAGRHRALGQLVNYRYFLIEEGIFSAQEIGLLTREFFELERSIRYRNSRS